MTRFLSAGIGSELYDDGGLYPSFGTYGNTFTVFNDLAAIVCSSSYFPLVPYTSEFPIGNCLFFSNDHDQPGNSMFRVQQIEIFYATTAVQVLSPPTPTTSRTPPTPTTKAPSSPTPLTPNVLDGNQATALLALCNAFVGNRPPSWLCTAKREIISVADGCDWEGITCNADRNSILSMYIYLRISKILIFVTTF